MKLWVNIILFIALLLTFFIGLALIWYVGKWFLVGFLVMTLLYALGYLHGVFDRD